MCLKCLVEAKHAGSKGGESDGLCSKQTKKGKATRDARPKRTRSQKTSQKPHHWLTEDSQGVKIKTTRKLSTMRELQMLFQRQRDFDYGQTSPALLAALPKLG